jgi:hypothetical protein
MIYLRARTYDTATGRFTTRDPASAVPQPGQPGNPYSYVGNDPLDRTDPRGSLLVASGGAASPGAASLARDTIGGIVAGATSPILAAAQDAARIANEAQHACLPDFPPGWPGLQSPNLFYEFGTPPTCTRQSCSEACGQPLTPFGSKRSPYGNTPAAWFELAALATGGGAFARLNIAAGLLSYWLQASGQPVTLSASELQTLYEVPNVKAAINATARSRIPPWAQNEFKRGQVVPEIDIPVQLSTTEDWQQTISPCNKKVPQCHRGTGKAAEDAALHELTSQCINQLDWFLALATFDYRIWNWSLNGSVITFSFEISKYYDQGKPILGFSTQQFQELIAEGIARNFWILGFSNNITIPVV